MENPTFRLAFPDWGKALLLLKHNTQGLHCIQKSDSQFNFIHLTIRNSQIENI
jgi:hypothetical protein